MAENTVGFTNQGTLDWTQLVARIASFSIAALARYSAAGVDTYTAAIGRLVSTQLQLSLSGRRKVETALAQLPGRGSYGDVLWFGFGIRHIIRELSSTDQGVSSVALCSALAECYHEDLAAEVLHHFVRSLNAPEEYTPSVTQCKTLIHACNGAFAATDFGTLLEKMMALNPYAWHIESHEFCGIRASRRSCSSPESMASALVALGAVSRSQIEAITIRGGSDAAWLAAVSEWLFGLCIRIATAEGKELYRSHDHENVCVTILYQPYSYGSSSQALEVASKVYVLEDASSIFRTRPLGHYVAATSGRVPWDSLLSMIFGNYFDLLLRDNRQMLALAIGFCARLLRGVVQADAEVPAELIRTWSAYTTDSYGKGYINSVVSIFPELRALKEPISQATQGSFVDARSRYESVVLFIKQSCRCAICCPELKNVGDNCDKFCSLVLVETILALGHVLAQVSFQEGLYPKRLGIESFYRYQVQKRRFPPVKWELENMATDSQGDLSDKLGPFAFIFQDSATDTRVKDLGLYVEIFTGYRYDKVLRQRSALSDNGICVHTGILHELTDDPNIGGKLHVMSGVIEHHGRPYVNVSDSSQNFEPVGGDDLQGLNRLNNVTLKVVDTASTLETFYEVSIHTEPGVAVAPKESIKIKPLKLQHSLQLARGWVSCNPSQCQLINAAAMKELSQGPGLTQVVIAGQNLVIFIGDRRARCAALGSLVDLGCKTLLQADDQCLGCSFRACISGKMLSNYFPRIAPAQWINSAHACLLITDPSAVRGSTADVIL